MIVKRILMILTKFVSVGALTCQKRGAVSGHFIKKHYKKEAVDLLKEG